MADAAQIVREHRNEWARKRKKNMALAPSKMCAHPGCSARAMPGENRCAPHLDVQRQKESERQEQYDRRRGTAKSRGYGKEWRKVRDAKLRKEPLCYICRHEGRTTAAAVVHHRDENQYNNDDDNLMSLCRECHERLHKRKR